jgi:hypothetical protein
MSIVNWALLPVASQMWWIGKSTCRLPPRIRSDQRPELTLHVVEQQVAHAGQHDRGNQLADLVAIFRHTVARRPPAFIGRGRNVAQESLSRTRHVGIVKEEGGLARESVSGQERYQFGDPCGPMSIREEGKIDHHLCEHGDGLRGGHQVGIGSVDVEIQTCFRIVAALRGDGPVMPQDWAACHAGNDRHAIVPRAGMNRLDDCVGRQAGRGVTLCVDALVTGGTRQQDQ